MSSINDPAGQLASTPADGAGQRKLSALTAFDRTPAPTNGAVAVPNGAPPMLVGVRIPTNNPTVRRHVYECYWRDELDGQRIGMRLLSVQVLPLVVGLVDTVQRRRKLAKARDALESRLKKVAPKGDSSLVVLTVDGRPRETEKAIADKDVLILKQLAELGWTPTSAARLGIDVLRLRDHDNGSLQPRADDGDVAGLEARVLRQLQGEGDDAD